jgi:hypothetical protein
MHWLSVKKSEIRKTKITEKEMLREFKDLRN